MTVKLQIVPRASVQLKTVLGTPGKKGDPGSPTEPNAVTNIYLADMPLNTIKGRVSVAFGDPEDLTADQAKSLLNITTSDVSGLGGLASKNSVSNTDLDDMAQSTIKGRALGAGTGDPQDLTVAQVKAILALASSDISDFAAAARAALPNGAVINSNYAEYLANADLTTTIPADDTIPQNTEGTQVLSVSLTPSATTSKVRVRFTAYGSANSGPNQLVAALFVNSGANAVRAAGVRVTAANDPVPIAFDFQHTPGSTSAQTYSVRVGAATGTARLNGQTTGRTFGGAAAATLTVEEVKA